MISKKLKFYLRLRVHNASTFGWVLRAHWLPKPNPGSRWKFYGKVPRRPVYCVQCYRIMCAWPVEERRRSSWLKQAVRLPVIDVDVDIDTGKRYEHTNYRACPDCVVHSASPNQWSLRQDMDVQD